ncbi:MAG: hypothetical protein ABR903_09820, partial [Thermodesulfovibrionales bacterium]
RQRVFVALQVPAWSPVVVAIVKMSFVVLALAFPAPSASAFTEDEIRSFQGDIVGQPLGERIASWAKKFVGTPYDADPLGEYVAKRAIVADERVDCMYLTFRALELAMSHTPEEAVFIALDKRFRGRGVLKDNVVVNYDERFQYGEDMIDSGKWGREKTGDIGPLTYIRGERGRDRVAMVSKEALLQVLITGKMSDQVFKSGDFVFFLKPPNKRVAGEIVGHIGIIKWEGHNLYLIHASGRKNYGGSVKMVPLKDYVSSMPFSGVRVTRFD